MMPGIRGMSYASKKIVFKLPVIQFLFCFLHPAFEGHQGKETWGWFSEGGVMRLWSAIPILFVWESVIVSAELEGCHSK